MIHIHLVSPHLTINPLPFVSIIFVFSTPTFVAMFLHRDDLNLSLTYWRSAMHTHQNLSNLPSVPDFLECEFQSQKVLWMLCLQQPGMIEYCKCQGGFFVLLMYKCKCQGNGTILSIINISIMYITLFEKSNFCPKIQF